MDETFRKFSLFTNMSNYKQEQNIKIAFLKVLVGRYKYGTFTGMVTCCTGL